MAQPDMYCRNCGTVGRPKRITKGSFLIELILWLCFLLPGLIYSIWRITTRYGVCPSCGAPNMIPASSPLAGADRGNPYEPQKHATLTNSPNRSGVLKHLLLAAVVVGVFAIVVSSALKLRQAAGPAPTTRAAVPPTKEQVAAHAAAEAQSLKEIDAAIAKMTALGFVKRMDGGARSIPGSRNVYVDGALWRAFNVDDKENAVRTLSRYRNAHEHAPQVSIRDYADGHELANYGALAGVTIR